MAKKISYSIEGINNNPGNGEGYSGGSMAVASDGSSMTLYDSPTGVTGTVSDNSGGAAISFDGQNADVAALASGHFLVATDLGSQIGYTIYDADAREVVGTDTITTTGDVNAPMAAGLAGGAFVVAYEKTFNPGDTDIRFTLRNADGTLIKNVAVDSSVAHDSNAAIAALEDGGFAVAWQRADGRNSQLWCAVYNADGSVRQAPTARDTYGSINADPQLIALSDGGFAVIYEDNGWTSGGATELTYRRFDASGEPGPYINLTNSLVYTDGLLAATVLENGMVVIASGDGGEKGKLTVFDPATSTVLLQQTFDVADHKTEGLHLAALPDGGYRVLAADGTVLTQHHFVIRNVVGDDANDIILGDGMREYLSGNGGADTIYGAGGKDFINGGAGRDKLFGQAGDDRFRLDSGTAEAGEVIDGGTGHDALQVQAQDLRGLTIASIETLDLNAGVLQSGLTTMAAAQIGTGFSASLYVEGNDGLDETLRIFMGAEDKLDLSDFTMVQFGYTEGRRKVAESSLEAEEEDDDLVLVVGDGSNETITGSTVADDIRGGGGNDTLSGGDGSDKLRGGAGNDIYLVNRAGEAIESADQGNDLVRSEVSYTLGVNLERLRLVGDDTINGVGNKLDNGLAGNEGNNVLNGREGRDMLTGGDGIDAFVFNTALDAAANLDRITDFETGTDKIRLDDAIFTGLTNAGRAAAFHVGASAADASDRIIYNEDTGALFFDADGAGGAAAIRFATLDAGLELKATDFVII